MKVLLIHNFYRSSAPSGEDIVYLQERRLLEERGIEVVAYERHNDDLAGAGALRLTGAALDTVWSRSAHRDVLTLIDRERPDVAHAHNTFPQISPSVYSACARSGVPLIQTLHNFRTICPGALLMRNQEPCEDCVGRNLLPALAHRCYRDSLAATGALVTMLAWHRRAGSYRNAVSRYVALTRFAAEKFVAGGLPSDRMSIRPNFLLNAPPPGDGRGGYALFVGRLTAEKGAHTLLKAWRNSSGMPPLRIVGEGGLRAELEAIAKSARLPVEFLGSLPRTEVLEQMRNAEVLIVPSECYEAFGLVAVEAYACGTPVIASDLGSLRELIIDGETGWRFPKGDTTALVDKVQQVFQNRHATVRMRQQARAHFDANYTANKAFESIIQIYAATLHPAALDIQGSAERNC